MSVKPIPEGYSSLCIDGARDTIAHAEPDFGDGRLQLSDPNEAYQIAARAEKAGATSANRPRRSSRVTASRRSSIYARAWPRVTRTV